MKEHRQCGILSPRKPNDLFSVNNCLKKEILPAREILKFSKERLKILDNRFIFFKIIRSFSRSNLTTIFGSCVFRILLPRYCDRC